MHQTRIIPAIDLIEGKCVRLTQGMYGSKKMYNENPLEVARAFADAGIQYLHLVDLDGAKAGQFVNWRVLDAICSKTPLKVDVGGGIKSPEDLRVVFLSGAEQANIGSAAVKQRTDFLNWLEHYGPEKIILSADVKGDKVAIHGWQDTTDLTLEPFIKSYLDEGLHYVVCTDISKDGMLAGPATSLYANLLKTFPDMGLVASGGVSSLDDVMDLQSLGLSGIIIGKAIYEERISVAELSRFV
ncbi:MAG: 1-(5-phosphoribosyl)-5-[(5-phosphoribosylamino)methylideneamino]imidazole-4-carboxamide isomerase [Bacteroidota bacterium]